MSNTEAQPKTNEERVEVWFPRDIAGHTMTVRLDSGLHRDLYFSNNGSSNQAFALTTWPGYLCFSGDMGTFVFRRLDDMFQFFRGVRINPHYWCEKLESVCRTDGAEEFDCDKFIGRLREIVTEQFENEPERMAEILADMDNESCAGDDESTVRRTWNNFEYGDFSFTDLWEVSGKVYTIRFLWCCHAIQWGIQQYDLAAKDRGAKCP